MGQQKVKVTDEQLRTLWMELGNTSAIARRIGYTRTGCHLALKRIGVRRLPRNGRYLETVDETAIQFAKDVLAGRRSANKHVKLVCQRFLDDIKEPGCFDADAEAAQHPMDFFTYLANAPEASHART